VWGNSESDVFAVGDYGTVLHYNGSAWSEMSSGTTDHLNDVWGNSGSDVFAVGDSGTVLHYNGSAWSAMSSGTTDYLYGVWGSSGSDVFAVGSSGAILHYNGSAWSAMSSGTTEYLKGVWGSSESDVFAVGYSGTILHYEGGAWSAMSSGTTDYLYGVWGSSPSDVFAVGDSDTILHYNGSTWSAMSSGISQWIRGVWGNSPSDVFAVASSGAILHYNGSAWSAMYLGTTDDFSGLWGSSASDIFIVGAGISHYDGSSWSKTFPLSDISTFSDVWGSSPSDIFAVGGKWDTDSNYAGSILHHDGTSWTSISTDYGTTDGLSGVWGSSPSDVFAVGYPGTIVHYDSSAWSEMDSGTTYSLSDVWGSSPSDVFAVGQDGTIVHYDGAWSEMDSGTTASLNGVWGSSASDVFAVGGKWDPDAGTYTGTILHYDGTSWTSMYSGNYHLNGVWGSSGSDVFVVGSDSGTHLGEILHYDGTSWTPMDHYIYGSFHGVWGSSGSDVFAVGGDGTILHYDGSAWSAMSSEATRLYGVWGSSGSDVFAVGGNGTILHYDGHPIPTVPRVTTGTVSSITSSAASAGGNATSDGGSEITARGVCWNTAGSPTIYDNKTSDGTGTGSFTSSITGLSPGTSYYLRAYATNSRGAAYGDEVRFTTISSPGIIGQNPLSVLAETPLTITLNDLLVEEDSDSTFPDDFTLSVRDGKYYIRSETTVTPSAGFFGELSVPVTVSDGENTSDVFHLTVTVAAEVTPKTVSGTVSVSEAGQPGLTVTAFSPDTGASASGITDADGKFEIKVSGGKWRVSVTQQDDADWVSPEPASVLFSDDGSDETESLSVALQTRIARITGRVLPPEGDTGISERVVVSIFNSDTQFAYDLIPGQDGRFFSFPVPPGTYDLSVKPDPETYPNYAGIRIPLTRIRTDTDLGDIRLVERKAVLSGTVTDDGGQGVSGIPVDIWQPGGEWFSATTDSGGAYSISLTSGTWMAKPSPESDSLFSFSDTPATVTLTDGEPETADFQLDAAPNTILGTVRDTDGNLLTDLVAWAYARSGDSPEPVAKARVREGGFTLNVPAGTFYVGLELAPGSAYTLPQETEGSEEVTIILEPADAFINGVVRDADGNPLGDVRGQVSATPAGNRTSVRTADIRDGAFDIRVGGGVWELNCQLETDRYSQTAPVRVVAEPGKSVTADIPLTPLGSVVSGRVTDGTGNPASDVLVWVRVPRGEGDTGGIFEMQTLTDSEGQFEVFVPGDGTEKRGWGSRASVGTAVQRCEAEEDEYEPPFKLTDISFGNLTGAGVPESVVSTLRGIAYQTHWSEYDFTSDLRDTLNSYSLYHRHKQQILEHAASGRTAGMVVSCLREAATQTTLPRSRPGWGRDARQDGVTLELRRADTFLAGTVLDGDGNPVSGAYVSAYSGDGQKTDGRTDISGDYRLYIARAGETDENGPNDWTVAAVSESGDGKYRRGRIQCDVSGTDEIIPAEGIVLTSGGELSPAVTGEFRADEEWFHTLPDGTGIRIPANAVPTDGTFVKVIVEPRADDVPENSGNHIVSHGYSVSLFEKESGREILGRLNRDMVMTFRYSGGDLMNQGIRTQNIRPAYFSEASGSWQRAESFVPDSTAGKITFQTDHLSVWSLVATQIGDEPVPGDMNSDGAVDLADVIAVLRVCVQFSSSVPSF